MAIFSLAPITANTDINVTLFNNMIAGINEALTIQNNGGVYIKQYITNVGSDSLGGWETGTWNEETYYTYTERQYFSDLLPSSISFVSTPAVICQVVSGVPLYATACARNMSTTGFDIVLQRRAYAESAVSVIIAGVISQ